MSKLAAILGPVNSRHRRLAAVLLGFIGAFLVGTFLFHEKLAHLIVNCAVIAVGLYFFLSSVGRSQRKQPKDLSQPGS